MEQDDPREQLAALVQEDPDAAIAAIFPEAEDDWPEVLAKHRKWREMLSAPSIVRTTPQLLFFLHARVLQRALKAEQLDYALATFDEAAAAAAPSVEQKMVRGFLANGAEDLVYALWHAQRHEAAEKVYGVLLDLSDRFPFDEDVSCRLAAAASYMAGSCCMRKDFKGAAAVLNDINHLPAFGERWREIDLLHARGAGALVMAMVKEGDWHNARRLTHLRRELLLWPHYLDDLATLRGAQFAADARELFEALIERYEELDPPTIPEGRGTVLDHYGFDRLQTVDPFEFLSLRVPARWSRLRKNERWGYWEEGVEAGTLWVDYHHVALECGPDGPSPELWSRIVESVAQQTVEDKEHGGLEIGGVQVIETASGHLLRHNHDDEEDGEQLSFHAWLLLVPCSTGAVMIHFWLVLLHELAHRPDFKELVQIMDREIKAAEIRRDRLPAG